jgi:HTH-type transcriptional regulator/antitoxin HipB
MEYLVISSEQLGETLKGIRRDLELTQEELGERIGFPQKEISRMETGAGRARVDRLFQMLSALEVEVVIRARRVDLETDAW